MNGDQLNRYSRQIMLDDIGMDGQQRLMESRVTVVGAGGLGTPILTHLVAMGVGHVRVVDRDIIELTNLHRQTLYSDVDIGSPKVDAAASRLRRLNANVDIKTVPVSVNRRSARSVVDKSDIVIDALDSVDARYALNEACVDLGIPFVSGGAVGTSGQVFIVVPGKTACYECAFPGLDEDQMPSCGIEGVNPAILSVIGGMEVAEAVRILCGLEPATLGSVLHINIATADFIKIRMDRVEECPACGSGTRRSVEDGYITEELCGRGGKRTFAISPPSPRKILQADDRLNVTEGDGSAIITGCPTEEEAIDLYEQLTAPA
ncbi:MAG: HesA/MoeB/ThiF family protein [Cenarchaeum sp. SB0663_bin_5]|nr:HesA/MoeB/ThiF family protein [Cenarchaeum sp. SB0663_bin_5]MYH04554.1 HesA/MoeB/ThiF family protein [Cenarchaeum sp. SB0675_bin_21]MYL10799.1 HesA/MoeB/ThiF family protein [Cenarchaeum sp. SB0669_bin_11]